MSRSNLACVLSTHTVTDNAPVTQTNVTQTIRHTQSAARHRDNTSHTECRPSQRQYVTHRVPPVTATVRHTQSAARHSDNTSHTVSPVTETINTSHRQCCRHTGNTSHRQCRPSHKQLYRPSYRQYVTQTIPSVT